MRCPIFNFPSVSRILPSIFLILMTLPMGYHAQIPEIINYQGRVAVNGLDFNGDGLFKFALVDQGTDISMTASAVATVSQTGFVTEITVLNGGNGYLEVPEVAISDTTGTEATAEAIVENGVVTSVLVTNAGSNYSLTPQVTIAAPPESISFASYWSHDNTSVDGSEPATAVTLPVDDGFFSVGLGDLSLENMTESINSDIFVNHDVRLRVWFDNGNIGFQQLIPDQRLSSVGYAQAAEVLIGMDANTILKLDDNGNLGIGSEATDSRLTVNGSIEISPNASPVVIGYPNSDIGGRDLTIQAGGRQVSSDTASLGGNLILKAGNANRPGLSEQDCEEAGTDNNSVQIIAGDNVFSDVCSTVRNGDIEFYAGHNQPERMRIVGNSGNVGIGTDTPDSGRLQIDAGSSTTALFIDNPMDVTTVNGAININNRLFIGDGEIQTADDVNLFINNDNNGDLLLNFGGGKVGIGTTSPMDQLHVWSSESNSIFTETTGAGLSGIKSATSMREYFYGVSGDNWVVFDNSSVGGGARIMVSQSGSVGIGRTPSNSCSLDVGGVICVNGVTVASDARWKKNIQPVKNALDKVTKLRGVTFEWREDENQNFSNEAQIGFIAQEVENVLPEIVMTRDDSYKSVAYANLTAVLVEAIKELKIENEVLTDNVANQNRDLTTVKTLLDQQISKNNTLLREMGSLKSSLSIMNQSIKQLQELLAAKLEILSSEMLANSKQENNN